MIPAGPTGAARAAETVARAAYGRLVAILAARNGDIAAAEDALADAFAAALATWPAQGVPQRPEAWLITAARHRLIDAGRRQGRAPVTTLADLPEVAAMQTDPDAIPDARLRLLFTCAHPAIDASIRTPLMLQTVLGLEAGVIARAFHLPAAAMAQRLVRAKHKIRDAGIGFALPDRGEMPARLPAVLEAVYGAYATAWLAPDGGDLSQEALFLADLLANLLPDDAEALGLAALIGLSLSRHAARLDAGGALVALAAQDTALWNGPMIGAARHYLARAQALGAPGRFQIEAAIEDAHVTRRDTGQTDWPAIAILTGWLAQHWPSLGALVQHAAALAEVDGPAAGLAALDALPPEALDFQPALATRAHLLERLGQINAARASFARALAVTAPGPLALYLAARQAALRDG